MPFDGNPVNDVQLTLIAARELVAKRWCKRAMMRRYKTGPAFCVLGAIEHVLYGEGKSRAFFYNTEIGARDALIKALNLPDGLTINIASWNDAKSRKKAQVLAVFDKAIAAS